MKIWYQSSSVIGFDPKWRNYEAALKTHVQKVARFDTKVDVRGVEKMSPKMIDSDYIRYLHSSQVIDKALLAEEEGYDAFVLGGTLDSGHQELREVLDIPVVFISECSFYVACLLAPRFSIIAASEKVLRRQTELIETYGLERRFVPGVHLGATGLLQLVQEMWGNPKDVIHRVTKVASKTIEQGAGALVPGFGALSVFLSEQNIREIDGVPVVDDVAAVIKMAELMVDLKKMGIARGKKGLYIHQVSKEDLITARKLYGVE